MKMFKGLVVPETTKEEPYIKFLFDEEGTLISLSTSSSWWGGINAGFSSSNGSEGNTCMPEDLEVYIDAFVAREISKKEKKIKRIQKKIDKLRTHYKV